MCPNLLLVLYLFVILTSPSGESPLKPPMRMWAGSHGPPHPASVHAYRWLPAFFFLYKAAGLSTCSFHPHPPLRSKGSSLQMCCFCHLPPSRCQYNEARLSLLVHHVKFSLRRSWCDCIKTDRVVNCDCDDLMRFAWRMTSSFSKDPFVLQVSRQPKTSRITRTRQQDLNEAKLKHQRVWW